MDSRVAFVKGSSAILIVQESEKMRIGVLLIISLFVYTGCAQEPPMVKTERNTFFSARSPFVQIEFPPDFIYLGSFDTTFRPRKVGSTERMNKAERTSYLYGSVADNNYMRKLIEVSVFKLSSGKHWSPETMLIVKNPIKRSIVKLGETNFQYCIKARETTNKYTAQYLLDKGHTTSSCYLWMLIGRVFEDNLKMYISYYEDISNYKEFGVNNCLDWKEKEMLNPKQKRYLQEFEIRAHHSINIFKNE
ncbi:MAG: hypothetical protein OEM01_03175 [Desulfobulbaceae bacterium]|nr:hypothetical protein [Desulfobulbaceae bacterium]